MPVYIALCDDQAEELSSLAHLLEEWQDGRHSRVPVRAFRSADALLESARAERFTLYLLDVMMPGTDGMAAAREIRSFDEEAALVFLTSSPGFAYESYSVHAMEYLLKPVSRERLFPVLDRLYSLEQRGAEGLTVKSNGTLFRIPFAHLAFVEVSGKHLSFHLSDGQVREVAGALKDFEDQLLSRPEFMRIHRSYIVNMLQIEELGSHGVRTFSGRELPVSRLLLPRLQQDYMQLLFEQRER